MQRVLAFLASIGIGLILTALGLIYDAKSLLYAGIVLLAFVVVLWLWVVANPEQVVARSPMMPLSEDRPPESADDNDRAMFALNRSRHNASVAIGNRSHAQAARAFHEVQAALVSAKRQFDIEIPTVRGSGGYLESLPLYVAYINSFYPHLREGHFDVAKRIADKFTYP